MNTSNKIFNRKSLAGMLLAALMCVSVSTAVSAESHVYIVGDVNCDETLDIDDAVLLFRHSMLPETYPIDYSGVIDFNGDGEVDIDDAVLLFRHSMLPNLYPLTGVDDNEGWSGIYKP